MNLLYHFPSCFRVSVSCTSWDNANDRYREKAEAHGVLWVTEVANNNL